MTTPRDTLADLIEAAGTPKAAADAVLANVPGLVWEDDNDPHRTKTRAACSFGYYRITQRFFPESHFVVETPTGMTIHADHFHAAKAAAEADYRARLAQDMGWA